MKAKTRRKLQVVQDAHRRFDQGHKRALEQSGHANEVPCKPGCTACCEQLVVAFGVEAAQMYVQYPDAIRQARGEIERQAKLLQTMGAYGINVEDYAARDAFAAQWFDARIPCPLLDRESGLCTVYEARPLSCRGYTVVAPDARECARRPDLTQGETVPVLLVRAPQALFDAERAMIGVEADLFGSVRGAHGPLAGLLSGLLMREAAP